jgi:hypothetical protein
MLQNSLHVNLLLTGILARLAHYSQPLLRSLLVNHSLVLETNVKSLFQVNNFIFEKFILFCMFKILSNLKSKLETISQTFNDFNYLVDLAHDTLYQRENTAKVRLFIQVLSSKNYSLFRNLMKCKDELVPHHEHDRNQLIQIKVPTIY